MIRFIRPQIMHVFILCVIAYVFFSVLLLLKNDEKYKRLYQSKKHHKQLSPFAESNFLNRTFRPNCYKKNKTQTFKVCEELPFTEIKCGSKYSRKKVEKHKRFLVPDVVFFVWFGNNLKFHFFNYLALRSAAAIHQPERIDFYYSISLPVGKHNQC